MKPFLKWAGNKQGISDRIRQHLPKGQRLVEPFAGSGAIFLATQYPAYVLNDVNEDLYRLYRFLKEDSDTFIEECRKLFVPANNDKKAYYRLRDEFNGLRGQLTRAQEHRRAAIFVYMNKHGFNGLCRYNQSGGFNVPFGRRKRPPAFPERRMRGFAQKVQAAELRNEDFRAVMEEAEPGDVVYADPPYVPLSETSSFTSYAEGGFGSEDQEDLAHLARECAARGVPVVISNHDVPFTRRIYAGAKITSFPVRRYIAASGSSRKKVKEVVAILGLDQIDPARHPAGGQQMLDLQA